jgi:hypothetical protein
MRFTHGADKLAVKEEDKRKAWRKEDFVKLSFFIL